MLIHNSRAYSLQVKRILTAIQSGYNTAADETCSERISDYVQFQSDLQRTLRTIDDSFANFDVVALPRMRIVSRTTSEALSREEDPKPLEPEKICNCTPFDIYGIPAISIPCGFSASGRPIGRMIAGPRFSEGRIMALANGYERATQWHMRKPNLTPEMPVPPITKKA